MPWAWVGKLLGTRLGGRGREHEQEHEHEHVRVHERVDPWIAELVTELAAGRRLEILASPELTARLDALVADGRALRAAEWLDKLVALAPRGEVQDGLCLRAAELRRELGDLPAAGRLLELLTGSPDRAPRAHYLLAEQARAQGDLDAALVHLEAVLALDVSYPNARERAEALRRHRDAGPAAAPALDQTLAGLSGGVTASERYALVAELGRGATGAVYRAHDRELARDVALKVLHPHLSSAARAGVRARFFAEARIAASLRHPNVVAVLDLDERRRWVVMELCTGGTLRQRLQAGPLAVGEALARHAETLSALQAAHRRGVVHRDLSPANLLFRTAATHGELVLGDFGIAHLASTPHQEPAGPIGTLAYMAPEQRAGQALDGRADLYAAGVVLWETLMGRLPWDRETALRGARAEDALALPEALARTLPGELATMLDEHLRGLGTLSPGGRPSSEKAAADARALVDLYRAGDEPSRLRAARATFFPRV